MWKNKPLHREILHSGANATNRSPPGHSRREGQNQVQERANQIDSNEVAQAAAQNINSKKPHLFSGAAVDRPGTPNIKIPPISEVVWQQAQEIGLINNHKIPTTETNKNTYMSEFKHRNDVESKHHQQKKSQPKYPDPARNHF